MDRYYFVVEIDFGGKDQKLADEIEKLAVQDFSCSGVEEFSINEQRVDDILGERAYSGGDIPHSVINEVDKTVSSHQQQIIKFFFDNEESEKMSSAFANTIAENYQLKTEIKKEKWQDWNEEWRKHYKPLEISSKLKIVPEWMREEVSGTMYIYPGTGFGTGEHETTYLCLKLLDELHDKNIQIDSCLDFGCGSGILGIAAIKLFKSGTTFCDVDRAALDNCLQNITLNLNEEERQGHHLVSRERFKIERQYDLVFANILQPILIQEKETLLKSLSSGGFLVLSGLLNEQVSSIKENYSELKLIDEQSKGDWSALIFKKEQ